MGDPNSTYVFSIDPGVVNVGVSCYDYATNTVIFSGKLTLAPSMKDMGTEDMIIPRVFKLFFDDKNSPYKKMINNSRIVLVENQMKRKMLLIQHVIGAMCFAGNIDYKMVNPRSIKAHFDIGSYARKKSGDSVKGNKNNHAANKKMAISKIKDLFPRIFDNVSVKKQDDMADSLLQAIWYGDLQKGVTRPKSAPVVTPKKKRKRTAPKKAATKAPPKKRKKTATKK